MNLVIPILLFMILSVSISKKMPVYEEFLLGVESGMKTVLSIFPTILGILTAVAMLQESGAMDFFIHLLSPIINKFSIPNDVIPLGLLRPISGGGSLGILTDILNRCGADGEAGRMASVMMGSTETTFYTLCVYFKNTRIKRTGKALPCALFGDLVGFVASVVCVKLIFGYTF